MKYAFLGRGKTGKHLQELTCEGESFELFHSQRPLKASEAQNCDCVVAFVNADTFQESLPELLELGKPVVSGVTGFDYSADLDRQFKERGIPLIYASNFALGMRLIHSLLTHLGKMIEGKDEITAHIEETHHTQKRDAPSGTALSWARWLGQDQTAIKSHRMGDVVGDHQLTLSLEHEQIKIEHRALDRRIFARGALWMARRLGEEKFQPGLCRFEDYVDRFFQR